jgi:hypothetical protein
MILAAKETQMPDKPAAPTARTALAQEVRARVAASNQVVAQARRHAAQAMAQVRYVDRLLHSTSQRSTAAEQAEETRSAHLVEVMEHEVAAHERAVALHEAAAELQEEGGWPERAAAAQEHVEELRKRLP